MFKVWENAFDNAEFKNWRQPAKFIQPNTNFPNPNNAYEFVRLCLQNVVQVPELFDTYMMLRAIRDIERGFTEQRGSLLFHDERTIINRPNDLVRYTPENLVKDCLRIVENYNNWENYRVKKLGI